MNGEGMCRGDGKLFAELCVQGDRVGYQMGET